MQIAGTIIGFIINLIVFFLLRKKLSLYIKLLLIGLSIVCIGSLFASIDGGNSRHEDIVIVVFFSLSLLIISYLFDLLKALKMQVSKRYAKSFGSPFSNKYVLSISIFFISLIQIYILWLR